MRPTPRAGCRRANGTSRCLLQEVGDIQVIRVVAGQVRLDDGREVDVEAGVGRDGRRTLLAPVAQARRAYAGVDGLDVLLVASAALVVSALGVGRGGSGSRGSGPLGGGLRL